jgi:peroxiredoxin
MKVRPALGAPSRLKGAAMKSKTIVILCVCIMLFGGFRAIAQTASENAFKELASNLQLHSKTMSPYEYVDWAEKSLFDFIAKHPNAPEVAKAHFLLGRLYASVGAGDKAVKHFDTYLKSPNQGSPEENAQMKYVIAASYLTLDKYDEAEKLYRDLARPGSKIDRRISEAAASDLTRIATLRKLVVGAPALEISGVSHEGKRISLKNYRGKVILLDFWATWCSPCRTEMPNVVKTYGDFQKKGFEIIGISLDSDETQFRNFIKDNKMSWPQLYDGKGWANGIGQQYAVASIPATYLVDKKGKIRFKNVRGEELRQAVQKLIDEK